MKSILDPSFAYTSSLNTDVRKTFARIRREQRAREAGTVPAIAERRNKVLALSRTPTSLSEAAHAWAMRETGRARREA